MLDSATSHSSGTSLQVHVFFMATEEAQEGKPNHTRHFKPPESHFLISQWSKGYVDNFKVKKWGISLCLSLAHDKSMDTCYRGIETWDQSFKPHHSTKQALISYYLLGYVFIRSKIMKLERAIHCTQN